MEGVSILSAFAVREGGTVNRLMCGTPTVSSKKSGGIMVESCSISVKLQQMGFCL